MLANPDRVMKKDSRSKMLKDWLLFDLLPMKVMKKTPMQKQQISSS
ncbi:hypothetical protein VRK_38640 [Vibrio sp. MEBiC08052]|nr:hypothetical protein VRK_38640 [Vibrio sp. MEBiC08052]